MLSRIAEYINKYTNSQIFRPSKDQESKWRHIKNTVLPVLHLLTVLICLICFAKLITKRGWIPFDCDHHPPPAADQTSGECDRETRAPRIRWISLVGPTSVRELEMYPMHGSSAGWVI